VTAIEERQNPAGAGGGERRRPWRGIGHHDAASRIGGVIAIGIVPALVGATGGLSLKQALAHGYQPAMIAMAGLCLAGGLVTGRFVSDDRGGRRTAGAAPADPRSCPTRIEPRGPVMRHRPHDPPEEP
jgi:hypothetical protein